MDVANAKISLGLKPSYFEGEEDEEARAGARAVDMDEEMADVVPGVCVRVCVCACMMWCVCGGEGA